MRHLLSQRHRTVLLCLAILAVAPAARAQAAAPQQPPPLREVENGFSIASEIGALWFFRLPSSATSSASGAVLGVSVGGDLGPLRLGITAWGQSLGAGADYAGIGGTTDPHHARGDFQTMVIAADLRLRLLSFEDAQGVARTQIQLRAMAGPSLSSPVGVLDRSGVLVAGGPGVLYQTRVRHFAVGLDTLVLYHLQDAGAAPGFAVLPSVRYTF
jgi:hypothetical protein